MRCLARLYCALVMFSFRSSQVASPVWMLKRRGMVERVVLVILNAVLTVRASKISPCCGFPSRTMYPAVVSGMVLNCCPVYTIPDIAM